MTKFLVRLVLVLLLLLYPAGGASGAEEQAISQDIIDQQLQVIDLTEVERFVERLDAEVGTYLPDISVNKLLSDLKSGELKLNPADIAVNIIKYLFKEVVANSTLLGELLILAVICAVLQNLQHAFEKNNTGKLAYTVTYLVLTVIAVKSFTLASQVGSNAIEQMVTFMQALLPIMLTLLTAMGGLTSAALLHPVVLLTLGVISTLFKNILFPLIFFTAVLGIVNTLSDKFQVSKLAGLFKDACMILLGLFLTVFVGVLTVYGVAGSVADGVTMRTAKFVTGAFIPVVGGMLSDALEAVVGGSLLIKNVVGIFGLLTMFFISIFPAVKIFSLVVIYRLAAALMQPIGGGEMVDALQTLGNSLLLIFAAVASVAVMFFMAILIIVATGNITVMMR